MEVKTYRHLTQTGRIHLRSDGTSSQSGMGWDREFPKGYWTEVVASMDKPETEVWDGEPNGTLCLACGEREHVIYDIELFCRTCGSDRVMSGILPGDIVPKVMK